VRVEVEGHTDSEGEPERNQNLSNRRARAVVRSLAHAGVAASRLSAAGYGAERPVATNDTPEGMAKNRRIEFKVFTD
jgi:OOP family OmpA-OmpF porin